MGDRKIVVTYSDNTDDIDDMHTYRVAVRAVSYMDRIHYYTLQREGIEWFQNQTDMTLDQELENPEHIAMRNLVYFRAEMLCAIDRERLSDGTAYICEYRNGNGKFERQPLPSEWTTMDGMAENMPPPLMDEWLEAVRRLNGGVLPSIPDFFQPTSVVTSTLDS